MRGCIRKLLLVRAITKVAGNILGDAKFTSIMTGNSVRAAGWH